MVIHRQSKSKTGVIGIAFVHEVVTEDIHVVLGIHALNVIVHAHTVQDIEAIRRIRIPGGLRVGLAVTTVVTDLSYRNILPS